MVEITGALATARATYELLKAGIEARDDAKIKAALADLQMRLFDATSAALAMAEKSLALQAALSQLQREKADLEREVQERAMYRLHEVAPGHFAYASQPELDGPQAAQHYLCQPCYDGGVKAVLRVSSESSYGATHYTCPIDPKHTLYT